VRVASFNLLSGRSLHDGVADPARLLAAVAALDADVLALQEVDRAQARSAGVDQARLVAEAVGAPWYRFAETLHGTPGDGAWRAADGALGGPPAEGPSYGVALISRLPVRSWHVLRLSPARGRFPLPVPVPGRLVPHVLMLPDEPRAAVAAVLERPRLTVASTHLSYLPLVNARQLRRVHRWLTALPGPHLLLGDLNVPARTANRITGWTPLFSAPTFPAPSPRRQLDHVLGHGVPAGTVRSSSAWSFPSAIIAPWSWTSTYPLTTLSDGGLCVRRRLWPTGSVRPAPSLRH